MNSIILTACGNRDNFTRCLETLKWNTDVPFDLLLIDSTPPGFEPYSHKEVAAALHRMDRALPQIDIVHTGNVVTAGVPSVKLASMWNLGPRTVKGDHILLTADDIAFGWHVVDHLFEALDRFNLLCTYPKHTDGRMPPDFHRRARAMAAGEASLTVGKTAGFNGCVFAFTRECWTKYGPFDEQFKWACIDDDWNMWLTHNGHEPREVCTALVHHSTSGSVTGHLAEIPGFKNWLEQEDSEDRRRFFAKWHMGQRPARIG